MVGRLEPDRGEAEPGPWEKAVRRILEEARRRHPLAELRVLAVPEWLLFHLARERDLPLRVPYTAGWAVDMVLTLDLGDVCVRTGWLLPRSGIERITAHTSLFSPPSDDVWFCHQDVASDSWFSLAPDVSGSALP